MDMRGCGDSDKPLLRSSYTIDKLAGDVACLIRSLDNKGKRRGLTGYRTDAEIYYLKGDYVAKNI